jgi:hypothetical protein
VIIASFDLDTLGTEGDTREITGRLARLSPRPLDARAPILADVDFG